MPSALDGLFGLLIQKLADAENTYREALAMEKKLLGGEHPSVAVTLGNLALVLQAQKKLADAATDRPAGREKWHDEPDIR